MLSLHSSPATSPAICSAVRCLPQNLRHIVTIQKFLLQPIIQHLLMGAAIKPGNLFTKTAIQNTILQRDDHLVILFELFQQVYIKPTDIARVNQRCCTPV